MRTIFLVGLLAVFLAGCASDSVPSVARAVSPTRSSAATQAARPPSPTSQPPAAAGSAAPAATLSALQMREAFLVVWTKYDNSVDAINYRHLRKTGPDYQAWCLETAAAGQGYVDGLSSIAFGAAEAQAAQDLIARAKTYESALEECGGHTSIRRILAVVPPMMKADALQTEAETALRIALNLPIGG